MEIVKAIWRNVFELLVLILILVPFMVLAPAGLVVLPLVLIAKNPNDDFSRLAQLFVWTAPLSCAFWTLVYSQWSSARAWRRMGRLKEWRRDHGGFFHTLPRAIAWMVFGLVASFVSELLFVVAFKYVPYGMFDGAARVRLWFALFPFSCYAPLFATWAWRRRHA